MGIGRTITPSADAGRYLVQHSSTQSEAHLRQRHVNRRGLFVLVTVQFHHPGGRIDPDDAVVNIVSGKNPSDDATCQRIHSG